MNVSLQHNMKEALDRGFQLVKQCKTTIRQEWDQILNHLHQRQEQHAKALETAIHFFTHSLFTYEHNNVEALFHDIKTARNHFNQPIPPKHAIFIITLLENAAHKAIKSKISNSYQDHQAIQYLFSQLSELMLTGPVSEQLNVNAFLRNLVASGQLPVEWIARVKNTNYGFSVKKVIGGESEDPSDVLEGMTSTTLFQLSERLFQQIPPYDRKNKEMLSLPWEEEIWFFCTNEAHSKYLLPMITFSLHYLHVGQNAVAFFEQQQQWKDAVILFNEWVMRSENFNEAIQNITSGFVHYLPFERCALFSYSNTEHSGFGLYGHHFNSEAIQNIKEDIENIPIIQRGLNRLEPLEENLKSLQPLYTFEGAHGFPEEYVEQFQLGSVIVAPIYVPSASKLIGAAILDQGPDKHFKVSHDTLTALTKFGQSAGELLEKFHRTDILQPAKSPSLSPRDIDILKLMADGASTSGAAAELNLSEYTVRDYISDIINKMNAKNRTEAVAKAIRNRLI
ncbi:LuxR C-terminal-related transcriptional regulator [Tuberibacillus sp. Marseille-P3662]|uniref:LuxR C-terminal-related transcriptional regulator n=1 Tax=Tuberibacillus sp. Marseille-P3662 TaxID=1965358 RepID=UPI000A1C7B4C|nr:LuxR C-terminal-related transcriptional regulator [Tuberibacillus sp. Marseille-P3662]